MGNSVLWWQDLPPRLKWRSQLHLVLVWLSAIPLAAGAEPSADVGHLRRQVEELQRAKERQERRIEALEKELERFRTQGQPSPDNAAERALDRALEESAPESTPAVDSTGTPPSAGGWGGVPVRLLDLSLDALVAGGASTASDEDMEGRLRRRQARSGTQGLYPAASRVVARGRGESVLHR